MVINGGSRSGSSAYTSYLGTHLQRSDTNERVLVREIDGIIAGSVRAGLREMAAIGAGSRSERPLYHANIDWRHDERMTDAQKARAVERLGQELGLADQPRIVVEHVKQGREHLHVVWLRIDAETMRAIPDSHNYRKHEIVARELEREFEHARVQGAHVERDDVDRPARCPTLGETRQAERSGMTAEEARAQLRELWQSADSGQAFAAALDNAGWRLAQGDRRGFVALDPTGEVRAVNKAVTGLTAAQVRERLADLDPGQLPTVDQAREQLLERQQQPEPNPVPEIDHEADELARLEAIARELDSRDYGDEAADRERMPEPDDLGHGHDNGRDLSRHREAEAEDRALGDFAALDAERAMEDLARVDSIGTARQFGPHPGDQLKSPEEMRREWADLMRGGVSADRAAESQHEAKNSRADPQPGITPGQDRNQSPDPAAERLAWAERLRGFASEAREEAEPVRARQRTRQPEAPGAAPEKERVGIFQKLRDLVRGWFEAKPSQTPPRDRAADRRQEPAGDRPAEHVEPLSTRQPMRNPAPQPKLEPAPQPEQEKTRPAERLAKRDFADELLAEARARLANQTPEQRAERDREAEQSRGRGDGSRERTRHRHSPLWELAHPFQDHRYRNHYRKPEP